ncbi:UNVERIFIED_CONTAM: hypothetical protein RMT77_002887 [Armadillidium vulgare]
MDDKESMSSEESEEIEFLGFEGTELGPTNSHIITQILHEIKQLQNITEGTPIRDIKTTNKSRVTESQGPTELSQNIILSNISPIISISLNNSSGIFSPSPEFSFPTSSDVCHSVFSIAFGKSHCSNLFETTSEKDSRRESFKFLGFEDENECRWDAAELTDDPILQLMFQSPRRNSIPDLEWDESSLMIAPLTTANNDEPLTSRQSFFLGEQECLEEDVYGEREYSIHEKLPPITEECSYEIVEEEITQSPRELLGFLEENYQLTHISSIPNVGELSPTYSVEGELLLKQQTIRRKSETGESITESLMKLIVETPVQRPQRPRTRSQFKGLLEEYPYIMSTPLEWKKRKQ